MFLLFLGQGLLYVIDLALFGEILAKYVLSSDRTFPIGFISPFIISTSDFFRCFCLFCLSVLPDKQWTGLFALAITGLQWCYYSVRILTTTLTFVLLYRYVFRSTKTIFTKMHVSFHHRFPAICILRF